MAPRSPKLETEAYPDSWQRFERAIDAGIKSGPKHREPEKKIKKPRRPSQKRASVEHDQP